MTGNNKRYEKGTLGWLKEHAKKEGFDNIRDWQNWKRNSSIKNIDHIKKLVNENNVKIKDKHTFYRFWSKVDIRNPDDCWNWTAAINSKCYDTFIYNGKTIYSHRMAYMMTKGSIDDGLQVQHLCNNPICCNPNHLVLGDDSNNMQYMYECSRGPDNRGEKSGMAILTDSQVRQIHKLYKEQKTCHPGFKQWQIVNPIAKAFNVSERHTKNIIAGERWSHIYEEIYGQK